MDSVLLHFHSFMQIYSRRGCFKKKKSNTECTSDMHRTSGAENDKCCEEKKGQVEIILLKIEIKMVAKKHRLIDKHAICC